MKFITKPNFFLLLQRWSWTRCLVFPVPTIQLRNYWIKFQCNSQILQKQVWFLNFDPQKNKLTKHWHISKFYFRSFPSMKMSIIDRWATHPLLAKTICERIKEELAQFPSDVRKDVIILFSAHSLPLKVHFFDLIPS